MRGTVKLTTQGTNTGRPLKKPGIHIFVVGDSTTSCKHNSDILAHSHVFAHLTSRISGDELALIKLSIHSPSVSGLYQLLKKTSVSLAAKCYAMLIS